MKYFYLLFITLVLSSNLFAQKISKYYTSKVQDDSELYFVFPFDGFCNRDAKSNFEYDLTYSTSNDSVVLNFSYIDSHRRSLEAIAFKVRERKISSKIKRIFVERKKNKWHYRYTSKFLFKDLKYLFLQKYTPGLLLSDKKDGDIKLSVKSGKWEKQALIYTKIFELIDLNR